MRLLFFTEARIFLNNNGNYWYDGSSFSYEMFKRYLAVFEEVFVLARTVNNKMNHIEGFSRVDGDGIKVIPLPYYVGPYQYIKRRAKIIKEIKKIVNTYGDASIICRLPGIIGSIAAEHLSKINRPYGVEVVGCPKDVFAPGSFSHPLRIIFRHSAVKNIRKGVKGASGVIYVTKKYLQMRYPASANIFTTFASNVTLPPESFVDTAKVLKNKDKYLILVVGTLDAMYKSPDIVIESLAILKKHKINIALNWIGGGRYKEKMINYSKKLGVNDIISFKGQVSSASEVRNYLDSSDIFILPSRQEGLPRALIEAMARGLPCIGTKIGGIPELLTSEFLVPVNDPRLLAEKISELLKHFGKTNEQASSNLEEAKKYKLEVLNSRREEFYLYIKGISKT